LQICAFADKTKKDSLRFYTPVTANFLGRQEGPPLSSISQANKAAAQAFTSGKIVPPTIGKV